MKWKEFLRPTIAKIIISLTLAFLFFMSSLAYIGVPVAAGCCSEPKIYDPETCREITADDCEDYNRIQEERFRSVTIGPFGVFVMSYLIISIVEHFLRKKS